MAAIDPQTHFLQNSAALAASLAAFERRLDAWRRTRRRRPAVEAGG